MISSLLSVASTFEAMRATRSPRAKEALCADLLRALSPDEDALAFVARFAAGRLLPASDPRVIGVGWSLVIEVGAAIAGWPPAILVACGRATGDLAEAVALLLDRDPSAADRQGLTLAETAAMIDALARTGRRAEKAEILGRALMRSAPTEAKYLLRAFGLGLRVGAQETLVLSAIALAFAADPDEVRRAFARVGDPGIIAVLAARGRLHEARFEIGRPAAFMLATPLASSAVEPSQFYVEDKIDGIRAQVHKRGEIVRVFARGLHDVSAQFPEIVDAMRAAPEDVALDGEIAAVALNGRPRPFLALAERIHKKAPSRALIARVPVAFFAFDLLALGDDVLLDAPWIERRARLDRWAETFAARADGAATADPILPKIKANPCRPVAGDGAIDVAFDAARGRGHEGLMLKHVAASYEAGRRTQAWIKVKRALATLDCVITAAEEGHGKRAGVWSDYTFSVWRGDVLVPIGKAYSGLKDAEIERLTATLAAIEIGKDGRAHVVKPEIVLEIAFDGLQRSRRHASGFALRFPRIVRVRSDKPPAQADTIAAVEALYAAQLGTGHREEREERGERGEREERTEPAPARRARAPRQKRAPSPQQLSFNFASDPSNSKR